MPQRLRGFTLIETLVYAGLLAIMLSFVLAALSGIFQGHAELQTRGDVNAEAEFLMGKIGWALAGAQSVVAPPAGVSSSTLVVNKFGFAANPLAFTLSQGTLFLARGSGAPAALNSANVSVSQATFTHLAANAVNPEGVSVVLTVTASTTERIVRSSTTVATTIYLRQ